MEKNQMSKRKMAGSIVLLAAVFIQIMLGWNEFSWYSKSAPFGTLIATVALGITFLCYVDIKAALKDPVFYLMVATDAIAMLNLILVHSNYGAILVVVHFLLMLYLANKVVLTPKMVLLGSVFIGFFFFYWTFDVKGYFKGYNTNFGGLVLITGFIFVILFCELLKEYLLYEKKSEYGNYIWILEVFFFTQAFSIIEWYRSRCAMIGLFVLAMMLLIPKKLWKSRVFYFLLVLAITAGSVLFTGLYSLLGALRDRFQIQIFYKDILSGREEIWSELFTEFLKKPLTGIGSSYVIKVEWMDGMLEVHNGLLDLLIIHGAVVFIVACLLLISRLLRLREGLCKDNIIRCAVAGIVTMLVTAFMENYVIVPPFSLIFLLLFAVINLRIRQGDSLKEV